METKRIFFNLFKHPRFAGGYEQNQLFISDVGKQNRDQVVPKLMIFYQSEINEKINEYLISHFAKY